MGKTKGREWFYRESLVLYTLAMQHILWVRLRDSGSGAVEAAGRWVELRYTQLLEYRMSTYGDVEITRNCLFDDNHHHD